MGDSSDSTKKTVFNKEENVGYRHFINAFFFSIQGLKAAIRYESAFRQELLLCVILVPLAFWIGNDPSERSMLVFSCLLVLVVELLNSAVEAVVDRFGGEHHTLSGRAKDLGSAAVMVSLLTASVVWLIIIEGNWVQISKEINQALG